MAQPISSKQNVGLTPLRRKAGTIAGTGAAAVGAVLLVGALALWFRYGTAVFFEMIASGIAGCF
jgi:hypothetical protein